MIVLLDSNIWVKELGLNTNLGSTIRFYLKQNNGRIALPELVKMEVQSNIQKRLTEQVKNISKNHRELLSVFRELKEIVLPEQKDIEALVSKIFESLGVDYIEIPFDIYVARSSLNKIINGEPPNWGKNQQFKDGVVWAHCVELLNDDNVIFVTLDRDFYLDKDYKKGLASNLSAEIQDKKFKLVTVNSLNDLLEQIKTHIDIDKDIFKKTLFEKCDSTLNSLLVNNGFYLGGEPEVDMKLFATEQSNTLYIAFIFKQRCTSHSEIEDALLTTEGNCIYDVEKMTFSNFHLEGAKLTFKSIDGEENVIQNYVILTGTATFGHKTVHHIIRFPVN